MARIYRRIDTTVEEPFEDDLVVMDTRTEAIVTLNGTAGVVWNALTERVSLDDLVSSFVKAFPGTDRDIVLRDVAETLRRFEQAGLVTSTDDGT